MNKLAELAVLLFVLALPIIWLAAAGTIVFVLLHFVMKFW